MKLIHLRVCLALSFVSSICSAATHVDDYSKGIAISVSSDRPLVEVQVPDAVYRTIARADLADIRVFNSDGAPVPHALCAAPNAAMPIVTLESLPVFELHAAAARLGNESQIDVNTSGGTEVRIIEETSRDLPESATQTRAHVLDARSITDALRSIQFEWRSPDGASEAHVRIEASEDLDKWRTVVDATTLLQIAREGQQLRRERVPLPEQRYPFLRVARSDRGPPLQITAVTAERVKESETIEPVWFTADVLPSTNDREALFDTARLAPVSYARLHLPQDNMSVRVRVQSRNGQQDQWRTRWSGEAYAIVAGGERRISPPAQFSPHHDRYWRVEYADPIGASSASPTLELGYRPARLRFLAQGNGPYTLAFGSRRAELGPSQQCASLISDVPSSKLDELVAAGAFGAQRTLGGARALQPLPKETPIRLIVLWAVLVVGVALLVAMALALLKRVGEKRK